ncbi:tripartite tricarboxylate transporter substrate binding protein [Pelobacter seleniigenes]|uniref:tripartite tricarboxylate transporter substrate binding protein n=1 Tax=Pelobacter seleniigenes TaxID=407188 RepID=UPI000A06F398|nr:tripartite tricarboxylate transporter substrate binding protein [Pelobacter seleniigenes]
MKQKRLNLLAIRCLILLMLLTLFAASAFAAGYPSKPIQVIVPVGAGGDTDLNARLFAKYLEKELGQSLVIVNVKGGGGTLGMKRVMESDPDGYTALFFHGEAMIPKLAGLTDWGIEAFEMVGIGVIDNTTVLATHPGLPYKTLNELIDYAKKNPYEVEFGIQTGGYPHLIGVAFEDTAGIEFNKVDVGGNAAKTVALKGHKIDVINTQYGLTYDYFKSGDFTCLGLLSEERNPLFPDVPTAKEQGLPLVFNKFFFYGMPKGTPADVVDTFSAAMKRVVENPKYQADAKKIFVTPTYMGPKEATDYAQKQFAYFSKFQDLFRAGSSKK